MFPVIDAEGSALVRGRIHGTLARSRIERSIATYARLFAYCGIDWGDAQRRAARYRDTVGHLDSELLEEIEGIAAGAGRGFEEILALNARTEILPPSYPGEASPHWQQVQELNRGAGIPDWGECTALAVQPARSATRGTLLAQNWDWLGMQREAVVLIRSRESDGSSCLAFTEAGMLAKIGLNEHGLGVCLSLMRSRRDGAHPGVPVHVLLRALLKRSTVGEAIELASGLTHGGSSNVLCADRDGEAVSLELSPDSVEVVRPEDGIACHTNHFLMPTGLAGEAPRAPTLSTEQRLKRILALATAHRQSIGIGDLQTMLRDESEGLMSICRHPDPQLPREARVETVASILMDLAQGVMHVAPDVPTKVAYHAVPLRKAVDAPVQRSSAMSS
ncbi:MAG: C45 family peptidase [Burkholderiales bacterium]|nr:C45 family peptidase [Burkholderiales bacterium]